MRHLARTISTNLSLREVRDGAGARKLVRTAIEVALSFLPLLLVGGAKATGGHLEIGVLGEAWLLPLVVTTLRYGLAAGLCIATVALAALSPPIAGAILSLGRAPSTIEWVGQVALFGSVVAVLRVLVARWDVREAGREGQEGAVANSTRQSTDSFAEADRVLASLANTVEIRDHHTQGHCRRVARNALVLGRDLGLNDNELRTLYWAATLHDLGKIAVPEYILLKRGRLSEAEYAEIRRHPMYGADLLASVSQAYRPIADVVRAHHERWDGHGYPLGLNSEDIPEMARVIAIVDVFEALTSERPYRSPMPEHQALQYVQNGAGTQFDPDLVGVFSRLYLRGDIECAGSHMGSPAVENAVPDAMIVQHV